MKNLIVKLLVKLVNLNVKETLSSVDQSILSKWLYISYKDNGWKQYYTLRKKTLLQMLSLGIDNDKEYWQIVGRMKELQALSVNINQEVKRREKNKIKSKKNSNI